MQIVNNNDLITIVDSDNNILYNAEDMADAEQFMISYIKPETTNNDNSSNEDFIPA